MLQNRRRINKFMEDGKRPGGAKMHVPGREEPDGEVRCPGRVQA